MTQDSCEPTVGVPSSVGGPTGDRRSRRRVAGEHVDQQVTRGLVAGRVDRLSRQRDHGADGRGRRGVAELERVDLGPLDQLVAGLEVDVVHVAALVVRGQLDLDRVARGGGREVGRVLEADDRRRRRVRAGREQVRHRALDELVARGLVDLLQAEAERHRIARGDDRAAVGGLRRAWWRSRPAPSPGAAARWGRRWSSCAGAAATWPAAAGCRRRSASGRCPPRSLTVNGVMPANSEPAARRHGRACRTSCPSTPAPPWRPTTPR